LLSEVHAALGVAVLACNGAAAAWGSVAWVRRDPSVWFWYLLRVAQASVVVQVALGAALLIAGEESPDSLHLFYGTAPLAVSVVSEAARVSVAAAEVDELDADVESLGRRDQILLARRVVLREMGVMTVGTLLIVTLTLRAAGLF
jgi:hypothetical protein